MISIFIKKIALFLLVIILIAALFQTRVRIKDALTHSRSPNLPDPITYNQTQEQVPESPKEEAIEAGNTASNTISKELLERIIEKTAEPIVEASKKVVNAIPSTYNLAIPFQPQAPHANWVLPYNEACEETSLIMADRFFSNRGLTADEADTAIKDLVKWQQEKFGYYEDTGAQEVATMAREYFGFNVELDTEVTVANIKQHLADNKVVVVPVAGRLLGNPYFSGEGPVYHMLVIRGYTQDKFITNDPGTRRGQEFLYRYGTIINAIHDWPRATGGDSQEISQKEMEEGKKVLLVIDKG